MNDLLLRFYPTDTPLRRLLLLHSEQVARRALDIARRHPELHLDEAFLHEAAMVHDVGIFLTDAPGIHCHGTQPYICHGVLGASLMRQCGREDLARVCERHTGTGLTRDVILAQGLPLPARDFRPESPEEQVICYADKFFSKSHPDRQRDVAATARSLEKFGDESVQTFLRWAEVFE